MVQKMDKEGKMEQEQETMLYLMILELKQDWKGKEQDTMLYLMILDLKQNGKVRRRTQCSTS